MCVDKQINTIRNPIRFTLLLFVGKNDFSNNSTLIFNFKKSIPTKLGVKGSLINIFNYL